MATEDEQKKADPDVQTPDPNPADAPQAAPKSWLERNIRIIGYVAAALIVLAALVLGLRHG